MGNKLQETGGGGSSPVAQDWAAILGSGLGQFGFQGSQGNTYGATSLNQMEAANRARQNTQGRSPVDQARWMSRHPDTMALANGQAPMNYPGTERRYTGGLGIGQPGQSPTQQTSGAMVNMMGELGGPQIMPNQPQQGGQQTFPGYLNQWMNADPNNAAYSNPNNPRPQDYTAPGAMNFDFSAINNPGASGLYNQANAGMMGLGNLASQFAMQGSNNPYGGLGPPPGGSAGSFASQGLLGDRNNVTSAIVQASNTQRGDAVADSRARFTANGGMSFGTPAAYSEALTNARMGEALNTSLANADLGYRNLDLGAYSAEENSKLGNRNIDSYNYNNQLQALNAGRNFSLNAMGQAGQNFQNVAGNEFNQQGMGFNYDQLGQQGRQDMNQLNLQSGLGFGQLGLDAFRANSNNWAQQGGMDMQQRGMMSAQQQNMINQLFGAYGQQAGIGTPQRQQIQVPTFGQNVLDTVVGGTKMAAGLGWQPFK